LRIAANEPRRGFAGILSNTQDELEEVRVVLHEERARYDELAILSEGYQMEAVVARETHIEVCCPGLHHLKPNC